MRKIAYVVARLVGLVVLLIVVASTLGCGTTSTAPEHAVGPSPTDVTLVADTAGNGPVLVISGSATVPNSALPSSEGERAVSLGAPNPARPASDDDIVQEGAAEVTTVGEYPSPTPRPWNGWRVLDESEAMAAARELVDPSIAWTESIAKHTWMSAVWDKQGSEFLIDDVTPDYPINVWVVAFKTDEPISFGQFTGFYKITNALISGGLEAYVIIDDFSGSEQEIGLFDSRWSYSDVASLAEQP